MCEILEKICVMAGAVMRSHTLLDSVIVSPFFFISDLTNSQLTICYYCETSRLVNTLQNFRNREEMVQSGSLSQQFAIWKPPICSF